MKVQNITDIEGFFKVVDSCEGKVELVTGEGDRLNLKSKLSQYVSMANIFSNGEIPELEIVAHEPQDIDKLVKLEEKMKQLHAAAGENGDKTAGNGGTEDKKDTEETGKAE